MTETGGPHIISSDSDTNFESIGRALPGMSVQIDKSDKHGIGEIVLYGRNIFMGYIEEPKMTEKIIDASGWLHTGDLGKSNDNACVEICGRIKELIITSGGENVSPVLIEKAIKSELPVVSHAIVAGEQKKFLSLLITLKCRVNENGMPDDELSPEVKNWCASLNCHCNRISEIISAKPCAIYDAIQKGIDHVNAKAISHAQEIRKFCILPRDFSFITGELGPTLKVKRSEVYMKYKNEIEAMYNSLSQKKKYDF